MMDWDKAYRDHHAEVVHFLYRRTGGNTELARDLTQDVFLRAMRGRFTDDGRGLGPWLTTIARNLLLDHFRRTARRPETVVDWIGDDWTPSLPSAETDALERIESVRVMRAVGRLDEPQRDAVVLTYWGRWSDRRIAEHTGSRPNTVAVRRWRAREILRRTLAEVA